MAEAELAHHFGSPDSDISVSSVFCDFFQTEDYLWGGNTRVEIYQDLHVSMVLRIESNCKQLNYLRLYPYSLYLVQ